MKQQQNLNSRDLFIATVDGYLENNQISHNEKEIFITAFNVHLQLSMAFWSHLAKAGDNRIQFVGISVQEYEAMTSPQPDVRIAQPMVEFFDFKWNVKKYKEYTTAISKGKEEELSNDPSTDPELIGFIKGVQLLLSEAKLVFEKLNAGEGFMEGELFIVDGVQNIYATINKFDYEEIEAGNYTRLIELFELETSFPIADKALYIKSEIDEFSRLFRAGNSGWKYLSGKLGCEEKEIDELYNLSAEFIRKHYTTFFNFDVDKRIDFGKLSAILKYIKFLEEESQKPGINLSHSIIAQRVPYVTMPSIDSRIELSNGNEAAFIKKCFMLLTDERVMSKNLSSDDIMDLLQMNFNCFGTQVNRQDKFTNPFKFNKYLPFFIRSILDELKSKQYSNNDIEQYKKIIKFFTGYENVSDETIGSYFQNTKLPANFPTSLLGAVKKYKMKHLQKPSVK